MFAFTYLQGLKLPNFKTPNTGAICDYMFLVSFAYDYTGKKINGLNFTGSDFSNVISAKGMFMGYNLALPSDKLSDASINLGNNEFSNAADVSWMFAFTSVNLDLTNVKMKNIQNADYMFAFYGISPFSRYQAIVKEEEEDIFAYYASIKMPASTTTPAFTFAEGASTNYMFLLTLAGDPAKFKEGKTATPQTLDLGFMDTQNVTSMTGMFMLSAPSFELAKLNTKKVTSTKLMFAGYGFIPILNLVTGDSSIGMDSLPKLNFPASASTGNFKLIGNCDTRYMFSCFIEYPGIDDTKKEFKNFDLSGIDVSQLTNFKLMFAFGLGVCNFDLSSWDITKAKNLDMMFLGYGLLARLDAADNLFFDCPASGRMLKLPTALPSAPTTSSESYCSAS